MPHLFETATTGRARCRGCRRPIERGALRFGERVPNPYADGETTLWFHPLCAAYKRPQAVLDTLDATPDDLPGRQSLERAAHGSLAVLRLPRIDGAERAPSGQARCRSCRQPIPRDAWRIRLTFYNEGRFNPGGFVHLDCRGAYFETDDLAEPLLHFSGALGDGEREELARQLAAPAEARGTRREAAPRRSPGDARGLPETAD